MATFNFNGLEGLEMEVNWGHNFARRNHDSSSRSGLRWPKKYCRRSEKQLRRIRSPDQTLSLNRRYKLLCRSYVIYHIPRSCMRNVEISGMKNPPDVIDPALNFPLPWLNRYWNDSLKIYLGSLKYLAKCFHCSNNAETPYFRYDLINIWKSANFSDYI